MPWWVLGLMILALLFTSLFGLFMASRMVYRKRLGWSPCGSFNPSYIEAPTLSSTTVGRASTRPKYGSNDDTPWVDAWVTRLFIALVLLCAAFYLISQFPGVQSPFWLGIVLQGFTYGSAALFYASGGDEPTGY